MDTAKKLIKKETKRDISSDSEIKSKDITTTLNETHSENDEENENEVPIKKNNNIYQSDACNDCNGYGIMLRTERTSYTPNPYTNNQYGRGRGRNNYRGNYRGNSRGGNYRGRGRGVYDNPIGMTFADYNV